MPVRLFVGNLPYDTTEAELREHFGSAGQVGRVTIPADRETGRPRGFAFVEVADRTVADEAIRRFHSQPFRGRTLAVSEARPREEGAARPPAGPRPFSPSGFRPSRPPDFEPPGSPQTRDRSRNFGPPAPPRRQRGPKRGQKSERAPKGPIREKTGGRLYDVDGDELEGVEEPMDFENFATSAETDEGEDEEQ